MYYVILLEEEKILFYYSKNYGAKSLEVCLLNGLNCLKNVTDLEKTVFNN